jgi:uncharacterized membrane protein
MIDKRRIIYKLSNVIIGIFALISISLTSFFAIVLCTFPESEQNSQSYEYLLLSFIIPIFMLTLFIFSFKYKLAGGLMLLFCGLFILINALSNNNLNNYSPMLIIGIPIMLSGIISIFLYFFLIKTHHK